MAANPQAGMPPYLQGFVPSIEFLDCAQVVETAQSSCVFSDCFSDLLVTYETSPLDPDGGVQTKTRARDRHRGGRRAQRSGGRDSRARGHRPPRPEGLRKARKAALKLDRHGYKVSDIYKQTPRAKRSGARGHPGSTERRPEQGAAGRPERPSRPGEAGLPLREPNELGATAPPGLVASTCPTPLA